MAVSLWVLLLPILAVTCTPTTKRVLVGLEADSEKSIAAMPVEAVEMDISSLEKSDVVDSGSDADRPQGAEVLSSTSRDPKAWHGTSKRLPRYRDLHAHKMGKNKQLQQQQQQQQQPAAGRDVADTNVYVVDETVHGYVPGAPGSPEEDPLLLQGTATGYIDSGVEPDMELLYVRHRLQKLDFYFEFLKVMSEDCRQRMLCEVSREPSRFYPLSSVLEDATSFTGSYQYVTSHLINTTEGARLLSYMEASFRGQDRARSCAVFQYRCPAPTEEMINYDALCLWREMVRWLTIHVVAQNQ